LNTLHVQQNGGFIYLNILSINKNDILFIAQDTFMEQRSSGTLLVKVMDRVEQELPTLPEHMSSPPVFSGVRVT